MKIIAHLDMDSFFASIELRVNPQYRGIGIVVGADPKDGMGRGVVSTANYQARKYGIHSALPISTAWRLAEAAKKRGEPATVFLPVNGRYYGEVSEKIFQIIRRYVPVVEQTSIDEAYLDLSFCGDYLKAFELIKKITKIIKEREKLTAKVGIAPNKLLAKMASARGKPDSVNIIYPQDIDSFLEPLSVRDIPGVGPKTEAMFNAKKIYRIADLKKVSLADLREWLGKWGESIYDKARGIDESPIETEREIKSISEQETFAKDSLSATFLLEEIQRLSERVIDRMIKDEIRGYRTVVITVRFSDFTTRTRSKTLPEYRYDMKTLHREALKLFMPFLDARENPSKKTIRLLGVGDREFILKIGWLDYYLLGFFL
ncbi:hypothetical protein A2773_06710 [Candidatus Gottesmanbacteria bacterium RIFCSPHIGHO2_01_FULL_39_10]|uniref:DNA polymerase IV n=1 Tax=Candidatus Gottesmanbacteria bacterium RIFCSPHIGHO2_01_FULL_39_10 TaxID=1798375 RepID=A0A1F5ZP55_9BACT|nr:MAG: hypothetical protein A2773_06710 [Candidatus Gottesmanbacteria bacterium RIFCSPHIGHO2_01_FULL_39_10]